jgi:hypothetical protein
MNILAPMQEGFNRWIDSVAGTVNGLLNRLQSNHEVRIIEEAPDTFRLHAPADGRRANLTDHRIRIVGSAIKDRLPADWAKMLRGSRAEIVLHANRFLFRPLELPKRAVEFLDGIVRGQIDRLTPWAPDEAVFARTPPTYGRTIGSSSWSPQPRGRLLRPMYGLSRILARRPSRCRPCRRAPSRIRRPSKCSSSGRAVYSKSTIAPLMHPLTSAAVDATSQTLMAPILNYVFT